jgi:SulP family sulfate permease
MRSALRPERLIPALLGGILIGILEIALATSFAALIFRGETAVYLSRGIGMALFSATIGLGLTSLLTSYPALMGGNQDAPAAIIGVMAAGIAAFVISEEARLATVIIAVTLTTLITGLFLLGLGAFRLAGLVRFLPYPVAGGFLAGTGWLLFIGGISTMARLPFSFTGLPELFEPRLLLYWLPGMVIGGLILALSRRVQHYLFMPGMIIGIIVIFYLIAALAGASLTELSDSGWLLGPFPDGRLWQPISAAELAAVDWAALWPQLPNLISAVVISAIALLLNATGLELAFNRDIDLNHEMRVAGITNIASGVGGGMVGYAQLGMSALTQRLGTPGRMTGLTAAAICGITLWFGGSALAFVPSVVFGALLVYLGLSFLWEWVVVARTRLPMIDYLIVLLILGVIAAVGFLEGVAIGIIATVTMFVVSYSRTSVVKYELTGSTFKSRVTRSPEDRALLEAIGDQAYFLQLQGFIFFGTANSLLELVRARIAKTPTRYVVIDFRQVIGLDSTALLSFDKMRQLAHESAFTLVLSGLSPTMRQQFDRGGLLEETGALRYASDLDRAVEWCEDQICVGSQAEPDRRTLANYLLAIVPGAATERLIDHMEFKEFAAGDYIIEQGAIDNQVYFIESGQVTAQLELPNATPKRLETMQGGRAVGELAFYLGTRRSAAVVADRPSGIYCMSRDKLARLEKDDPEAAYAFHRVIIHVLGERVLHLVRAVDALQN